MSRVNTVLLHGGLGNQLFQHAALLSVSGSGHESMRHLFAGDQWPSGHPTLRDLPGVDARLPTIVDMARWRGTRFLGGWKGRVLESAARLNETLSRAHIIRQLSPFDARPNIDLSKSHLLDGYFQHPSWFRDEWEHIAREILDQAPAGFQKLVERNTTVVKVRRSDYVNLGWDLPQQYFIDAFSHLSSSGGDIVVSCEDDSEEEWLTQALAGLAVRLQRTVPLTGNAALDDFWNIAAAETLVLANSSFCWWAAAVATVRSDNTRVIYPDPWIVNLWDQTPPPNFGLPSWQPVPSGLPLWRLP